MKKTLSTLSALIFLSPLIPTPAQAAFKDVSSSHPYVESINYVQSQGIVSGYPDGTYQPDRLINRAEFTKIIVASRFTTVEIENCVATAGFYKQKIFTDVDNGAWFEKYICLAKKNKIIDGYADGSFKPTQTINFAEAAKIVVNSNGLSVSDGDPWFAPYLAKLASFGAIPPSVSSLGTEIERATKELSRGEMASVIFGMQGVNDTVTSDDGSFSIKIPETALPEGFDRSELSVRKISQADSPVREINGAPMVFYELKPDGLMFRQKVSFSVTTATSQNTIPLVFLVSGDSFDIVAEPLIEIDQTQARASISGQLEHFSLLGIGDLPLFSLETSNTPDQKVGVEFSRTASIEKNTTPNTFVNDVNTTSVQVLDDWSVSAGIFQAISGDIIPSLVVDVPDLRLFSGPTFYSSTEYFTCGSPGVAVSKYHFTLEFTYIRRYGLDTVIKSASIVVDESTRPFDCVP